MASNFEAKVALEVQEGGVNSGFKGIDYQIKMMLLAITKTFENLNNINFEVSTEIKAAAPFDDVILKVTGDASRFIQCKSKESPVILSYQSFFDKKNKNYYLAKYFVGYVKIKENFHNSGNFVIATNNSIPKSLVLCDGASNKKIKFVEITGSDEVFGSFVERFKLDENCKETYATIRSKLIQDLSASMSNATQTVDKHLNGFLMELSFVFSLNKEDIEREIDEFIQKQFNLSVVDVLKSTLMSTLYGWIETMKTAKSINRNQFEVYLKETREKSEVIPKVIDRTSAIFRSSSFTFEIPTKLVKFIRKFETVSNQLFYLQVQEGDTFYGSCMIHQELKLKTSDEFLFLSTNCAFDIADGLKVFEMENCFQLLVFVADRANPIEDHHKSQIIRILSQKQNKKALIITDQIKSKFAADLIGSDENLHTIQEIKLSDLTQQSLNLFLEEKKFKFQGETVKLASVLDSLDQNLIDATSLKNLVDIQIIGHNVIEGKNFDPSLYIERQLRQRNVVKKIEIDLKTNEKLVRDETSFVACCNQFPGANVHLLEQINERQLVWKKSHGRINFLFDHIDGNEATVVQSPGDSGTTAHKAFVLVDIAGMGKTSWMNHLAHKLKKKHKSHFIVNISFNDHTGYFQHHKFKDENSVLTFLECEVLKLDSDIEKKLFRSACTSTGKVQVILDGLDEVCPNSESEMFKMIEMISTMKIEGLYVSTRPELRRQLEQQLQNFSHEFVPFSETDQRNFLIKFWSKSRRENLTDDELRDVAEKVVLSVGKKVELTQIAGIPLITKMMAEIFDSEMITEATLNDSVVEGKICNLSKLYEEFVNKNIKRYLTEKLSHDMSKSGNQKFAEGEKQKFVNLFKKMALKLILPHRLNLFYKDSEFTSDELEEMRKCGLILSGSEIKFLHKTIAEYFVFLVIQGKFTEAKVAELVVQEIFCGDKFAVIRSFFNSSIEKFSGGLNFYGKILMKHKTESEKSIQTACSEDNTNVLQFIFESLFACIEKHSNAFKSFFALESKLTKKFVLEMLDKASIRIPLK